MADMVRVRRALISVSDKTGVVAFARDLASQGVEIVSTGGTARALAEAGVAVRGVESLTGFPEMMDGRVKTLHPGVHGGILAVRGDAGHEAAMKAHGIDPIDLVCVNLYPFREAIARPGCTRDEAVENIDIGGPAMARSAAKNHEHVAVVTSPGQYGAVLAEMNVAEGCTSRDLRRQLAAAAFAHTAEYDAAIAGYMTGGVPAAPKSALADVGGTGAYPREWRMVYRLLAPLRYGENPHQSAAVYADDAYAGPSVVAAEQVHGKELSYNNLHDANAALELVMALGAQARGGGDGVAACVIKHANPCGAAVGGTVHAAVVNALAGDPLAAFGGIMAVGGTLDGAAAARLCEKDVFLEVLLGWGYTEEALSALRARWQNLRILHVARGGAGERGARRTFKPIAGGLLVQDADTLAPDPATWQHRAGPAPTAEGLAAAAALEVMVRAMNSNAVAIGGGAPGGGVMLLGAGLGQVDRVAACRLAVEKAGLRARGAVAVSDAFFPFADGPTALADAGVSMIVHTGGSKRDQETFDLCAARGITCMTTGVRRFQH